MATEFGEVINEWAGFDPRVAPVLGTLASREQVVDRPWSHNHLADDLPLTAAERILKSALSRVNAASRSFVSHSMELPGVPETMLTRCVPTDETDEIIYAYRPGRRGQSRFVLDRDPEPTNAVRVSLSRSRKLANRMVLITANLGATEPEPWDKYFACEADAQVSQDFWLGHALVFDPMMIDFREPNGSEPHDPTWRRILGLPEPTNH